MDISKIRPLIASYMEQYKVSGAEVILQVNGENYVYSFGYMNSNKKTPITPQTIFELGSVTKTFIGLLLSEQILSGNLKLNDSLAKYVSDSDSIAIKKITLLELATHTSGLPFGVPGLPYNASQSPEYNAVYTHFLRTWTSEHTPGSGFMYSNIGFSILADALTMSTNLSLSESMQMGIFQPLNMRSSMLTVTKNWSKLYAQDYTSNNTPERTPETGLLGGSWAMKSSGQDMTHYLDVAIGNFKSQPSVVAAMKIAQTGYFKCISNGIELGLGWIITPLDKSTVYETLIHAPAHFNLGAFKPVYKIKSPTYNGSSLIDKIGATDGFRTYIGVIPSMKLGIVILTNKYTDNTGELQNIGRKILFSFMDNAQSGIKPKNL
ncbi:MAG: serine hydrolase [Legionellales bacterium]|nr:serine hydrolase [Legionellales bacterium]